MSGDALDEGQLSPSCCSLLCFQVLTDPKEQRVGQRGGLQWEDAVSKNHPITSSLKQKTH